MLSAIPKPLISKLHEILDHRNIQHGCTMHIITIEGPHGSGKDLTASLLMGMECEFIPSILRFADPLRKSLEAWGLTPLDILKRQKNLILGKNSIIEGLDCSGMTVRSAMIAVAEGNKHMHGQNYYSNILLKKIEALDKINDFNCIIIPDLRFEVEIKALQSLLAQGVHLTSVYIGKTDEPYDFTLPELTVMNLDGGSND